MATRSLSYRLEEQAREEIGESALILSQEVRDALVVLEREIDAPNRYTIAQHRLTIKWLVTGKSLYSRPKTSTSPVVVVTRQPKGLAIFAGFLFVSLVGYVGHDNIEAIQQWLSQF